MTRSSAVNDRFARLEVRAPDAGAAERVAAEAYAAGAIGLEERDEGGRVTLVLYVRRADAPGLYQALVANTGSEIDIGRPEDVPEQEWSESWKRGLSPVVVSPRLAVRPSFVAQPVDFRGAQLLIDPGQAFGTGAHASTHLALEWIDDIAPGLGRDSRVLDVGAGTGVLALAALLLSPARAVAVDVDPLATCAVRENAVANGLLDRIGIVAGPLDALRVDPYELVLANLLRTELVPLLGALAAHTAPGGAVVLSGLLADEVAGIEGDLDTAGLRPRSVRHHDDESGVRWVALLMTR